MDDSNGVMKVANIRQQKETYLLLSNNALYYVETAEKRRHTNRIVWVSVAVNQNITNY